MRYFRIRLCVICIIHITLWETHDINPSFVVLKYDNITSRIYNWTRKMSSACRYNSTDTNIFSCLNEIQRVYTFTLKCVVEKFKYFPNMLFNVKLEINHLVEIKFNGQWLLVSFFKKILCIRFV